MNDLPFVSIITPVFNGEKYLSECIESVLNQTYGNFEYIIINNCSTDRTLEIATKYEKKDNRVQVHTNNNFVGVIENHNIGFRLTSDKSKYCKVVSADDWLFPECLSRMIELAEANPSVGIVGSYQLSGGGSNWRNWRVRWDELPYPSTVISGRESCRSYLLGGPYVFGTPTSLLYRSDLVKRRDIFYPGSAAEADTSACVESLQHADFGFVHQVLSYERIHESQISEDRRELNAYLPASISNLIEYGPFYLTEIELKKRLDQLVYEYYYHLAIGVVNFRGKDFFSYHKKRLEELGYNFYSFKLFKALCLKLLDLLFNPKKSIQATIKRLDPKV